jgi:hypothetical protein
MLQYLDALIGIWFEWEPMVMIMSMPSYLIARLQEKINSLLFALQEAGWHKPGCVNLVLLLKPE